MLSSYWGQRSRRVLMLGLDGLAPAFVQAPLVQASMPNLQELLAGSACGPLWSTFPPYTAPAWTSITTGVDPGRHGIFGFTDPSGRPIGDSHSAAPRIWDYVGAAGGRSIVVNVPITFPPRQTDGVLISGMPVPDGAPFTWPHELGSRLEDFSYVVDVAVREGAREGRETFEALRHMTEARGRAAAWLARTEPWDFFGIVFVLPDRLGHPWWKQLVPGSRHYDTQAAEKVRRAAVGSLKALDGAIGELLAALPPDTAVVACSDHGFGPLDAEVFADVALAEAGLIEAPYRGLRSMAGRLGRSKLARLAPERLHRTVRDRLGGAGGEDKERLAFTSSPYESGVRLAHPGDEPVTQRVIDVLEGIRTPRGGLALRSVRRREDVYEGPRTSDAPELLCETSEEAIDLHDGLHAASPWVSREGTTWGTHFSQGVIALPRDAPSSHREGTAADVAPTVLALLGLEAEGLDGQALTSTTSLAQRELVHLPLSSGEQATAEPAYSAEQEEQVLEHLRGLGYVD